MPATPFAKEIFDSASRAAVSENDSAGLVCNLNRPTNNKTVAKIVIAGKDPIVLAQPGQHVFLPAVTSEAVRRLSASLRETRLVMHNHSLLDTLFLTITVVGIAALVWRDEKTFPFGQTTGRLVGPPPWQYRSGKLTVTCLRAPRAAVESLLTKPLATASEYIADLNAEADLLSPDPDTAPLDGVIGLVGWADPRAQALITRFNSRYEALHLARQSLYAEALLRASQRPAGEVEVSKTTIKCRTIARGQRRLPCSVSIELVNRSPVRIDRHELEWSEAQPALDAVGHRFIIHPRSEPSEPVAPGARFVLLGTITAANIEAVPEPPLLIEMLELPRHEPIVAGSFYSLKNDKETLQVTSVRCAQDPDGIWRATIEGEVENRNEYETPGRFEAVAIPSGESIQETAEVPLPAFRRAHVSYQKELHSVRGAAPACPQGWTFVRRADKGASTYFLPVN